jgi:RNA polymerase sigma factor (sigma-70 family)
MENAHEDGVAAFVGARRRLFGIAYRMLGSAAEAEDLLQDVWLRWQAADRSTVSNPAAFLATTTARLAINLAQSARSRRERCVGPAWPEPEDARADPALRAERREALELALLLLMESLSPKERAAYILREAFGYPYPEVASVLRLTEANTRQLISRARKHIGEGRRARVSPPEQRLLLDAFIGAAQKGDLARLERMLKSAIRSGSVGDGALQWAGIDSPVGVAQARIERIALGRGEERAIGRRLAIPARHISWAVVGRLARPAIAGVVRELYADERSGLGVVDERLRGVAVVGADAHALRTVEGEARALDDEPRRAHHEPAQIGPRLGVCGAVAAAVELDGAVHAAIDPRVARAAAGPRIAGTAAGAATPGAASGDATDAAVACTASGTAGAAATRPCAGQGCRLVPVAGGGRQRQAREHQPAWDDV